MILLFLLLLGGGGEFFEFFFTFALVIPPLTLKNRPCALIWACALNRKNTVVDKSVDTSAKVWLLRCCFPKKSFRKWKQKG